jgi:hypothetical protein
VVIDLTEAEKFYVMSMMNQSPPSQYIYCKPCWKLLSNRQQGAQFIAGSVQALVRSAGHPKSAQAGKKMLNFLIAKSGKPVS